MLFQYLFKLAISVTVEKKKSNKIFVKTFHLVFFFIFNDKFANKENVAVV